MTETKTVQERADDTLSMLTDLADEVLAHENSAEPGNAAAEEVSRTPAVAEMVLRMLASRLLDTQQTLHDTHESYGRLSRTVSEVLGIEREDG